MSRSRAEKPFATEAAMCAVFLGALPQGWTPYAETAGWDILLVRDDGLQIGVQAKLKLNAEVFSQALEDGHSYQVTRSGPDCRAVMVPYSETGAFGRLAAYIGVTIIHVRGVRRFQPELPKLGKDYWGEQWFEQAPAKRHKLPEYVPDVAAGASAPMQLTDWKISAIKLLHTLEVRGFVTREDFKHYGLDHRRWVPSGWLTCKGGRYFAAGHPDLKAQHPRVYAEIVADAEKWMRKDLVA